MIGGKKDKNARIVIPYESDHEGDSLPCPKRSKHSLDVELDNIEKKHTKKEPKWTLIDTKGKKNI